MPANKNALIRYKTIDNCLRNPFRRWRLDDLVDACSEALYDCEGIRKGVSLRTVQGDLQMMRSDKLGYNAPIEVYDQKYYRYARPDYSIMQMPLSPNDLLVMQEAVDLLRELEDFEQFSEMSDVIGRLQDRLALGRNDRKPIIHFDSVPNLQGRRLLSPLYNYIAQRQTLKIAYQSFKSRCQSEFILCPHLLKEFRNRWFLFGSQAHTLQLYNLSLDRILSIEPVDVPFRDNPDFDLHFFDNVIGVSKDPGNVTRRITFWADSMQSRYIKTKPLHHTQRLLHENPDDRSCTFQIEVIINSELFSVFMSYGPGVRILSPRKAARYLREQFRQAAEHYDEALE